MVKNDINPAHLERKKQKQKDIKKQQRLRQTQRLEKIKNYDVDRLRKRISLLQEKKKGSGFGKLPAHEEKTLVQLESDLKLLVNHLNLDKQDSNENDGAVVVKQQEQQLIPEQIKLGKKSIFYEPEWNPLGKSIKSRPDLPNIEYPLPKSERYDDYETTADPEIPLPLVPQPRFYKLKEVSNVIISKDEVSRGESTKERIFKNFMLPSHLLQREVDKVDKDKGNDNDNDNNDDDYNNMAEEEEEYWRQNKLKRKLI